MDNKKYIERYLNWLNPHPVDDIGKGSFKYLLWYALNTLVYQTYLEIEIKDFKYWARKYRKLISDIYEDYWKNRLYPRNFFKETCYMYDTYETMQRMKTGL